ncbi:hypothetical protein AB833_26155 [Chromatiales bacterium (ex Bugula neritina AB1)]|nr:hypothetical protein AB833_26155 [Chromatiales bacterium (ex Bugula neritina AB1)]
MTSNHAKAKHRLVVFVVYPGVTLLDVTGPAQVFSSANAELSEQALRYEVVIASDKGGLVATDTGIEINTQSLSELAIPTIDTLVVAGGNGVFDAVSNTDVVSWLKMAMPVARRVISTCMGVFLTAETGLLGNRTVTTHWRWTDKLRADYPELDVVCEPIFINQGNFASTAGVTAGIDLCLALVEEDHSRRIALSVARNLVLYLRRTGTQLQFSSSLLFQASEQTDKFEELNTWIDQNMQADLSVEVLAKRVDMSPRNFSRAYAGHVGYPPGRAVELIRFERAKIMLETTSIPIKKISLQLGFKNHERMRRTFIRHTGIGPAEYRQRFGL